MDIKLTFQCDKESFFEEMKKVNNNNKENIVDLISYVSSTNIPKLNELLWNSLLKSLENQKNELTEGMKQSVLLEIAEEIAQRK